MSTLPELRPEMTTLLISIRATFAELKKLPPDYDFQMPALISHVEDYSEDLQRLRKYAGQVIGARIMQFGHVTLYKTYYFLDMFLRGYTERNMYEMLFAARALVEVYAVTADVYSAIHKNAGDEIEGFIARIKHIDQTLIKATYGTRLELVKGLFRELGSSKLREVTDADMEIFNATSVLTRIDRVSRSDEYSECRSDYDRLSEYVHPNTAQNMILAWPSPKHPEWLRLSRRSKYAFISAVNASAAPAEKVPSYPSPCAQWFPTICG